MANLDITNIDYASIALSGEKFRDELLTFAGTDTFVKGTILARRRVATAVVASAVSGGGTGTVTAASVVEGSVVPKVGVYTLRCISAVTHGGVWQLEDPNGAIVATGLTMTAGSGVATTFEVAGLTFIITDGGTDFSAGATATLTVAADGTLVPFNPAGVGGAQFPIAVLTYEVSRVGAGTVKIRALVEGEVNKTRLIIDVDGTGANVTATVLDQLRDAGIMATDVQQLASLDNQ